MNYEVNCRHCGRYIATARGTTILEQMVCPNSSCKAKLNIKVVNSDSTAQELSYTFSTKEQPPKQKEKENV